MGDSKHRCNAEQNRNHCYKAKYTLNQKERQRINLKSKPKSSTNRTQASYGYTEFTEADWHHNNRKQNNFHHSRFSSSSSSTSSSSTSCDTRTKSNSRADTKTDTKTAVGDLEYARAKLPNELLEAISNQVLEHTKELGLFDEIRMKLLDAIETQRKFQVMRENFHQEVHSFCMHKTNLAESRGALREQLNDCFDRGQFRSTSRLGDSIDEVMHKYEHELRQQYNEKSNELRQLISQFKLSAVVAKREPLLDTLSKHPKKPMPLTPPLPMSSKQAKSKCLSIKTNLKRTNAQPQVVANILTPSPSISPPQTPPTPPTHIKRTNKGRNLSPRKGRKKSNYSVGWDKWQERGDTFKQKNRISNKESQVKRQRAAIHSDIY